MADDPGVLLRAAGGLDGLAEFNYVMAGHSGGVRGETLQMSNAFVLITISADWLEGELEVRLQGVGGPEVPLAAVVDTSVIRALHLSRIKRGASVATIEATLRKVADSLIESVPDVLAGTPEGLAKLGVR